MDPLTNYEIAKFQMAERLQQAARERMARGGRSFAGRDDQGQTARRRWSVRGLVGRITLANGAG
jgi:hypothetical protein